MIVLRKTLDKVVTIKNADIKIRDNKISNLCKQRYKDIEEIEKLKEEIKMLKEDLHLANTEIEMKENTKNHYLKKWIQSDKELRRSKEIKRQYKKYIDEANHISVVRHEITETDVRRFASKKGIKGIIDLYMLASLM